MTLKHETEILTGSINKIWPKSLSVLFRFDTFSKNKHPSVIKPTRWSRWLQCSTCPSPTPRAHSWPPQGRQTPECHASPSLLYPSLKYKNIFTLIQIRVSDRSQTFCFTEPHRFVYLKAGAAFVRFKCRRDTITVSNLQEFRHSLILSRPQCSSLT